MRDFGALVGRILLALIFVLSGFEKIMNASGTIAMMAAHGVPVPPVAFGVTLLIEFGCGLLLILGYQTRWAALLMFLWFIPVTLMFHVAGYQQAAQQHDAMGALTQQIMIMKNLSILGGLLLLASLGPGALSLDGRGTTASEADSLRAA
jgi:putative oxidoreductase